MKKYLKYLLLSLLLLFVGLVLSGAIFGFGKAAERSTDVTRYQCQTVTSSPIYLTPGAASSTCIIDITTVKNANLHVRFTASTSVARLNLSTYVSFGETAATLDWYGIHTYSDTNNTRTWGVTPIVNSINGNGNSSTTLFVIPLTGLRANQLKIEYSVASTTAEIGSDNGSVYLELIKDND